MKEIGSYKSSMKEIGTNVVNLTLVRKLTLEDVLEYIGEDELATLTSRSTGTCGGSSRSPA